MKDQKLEERMVREGVVIYHDRAAGEKFDAEKNLAAWREHERQKTAPKAVTKIAPPPPDDVYKHNEPGTSVDSPAPDGPVTKKKSEPDKELFGLARAIAGNSKSASTPSAVPESQCTGLQRAINANLLKQKTKTENNS